jgi:hypothetical protein
VPGAREPQGHRPAQPAQPARHHRHPLVHAFSSLFHL